MSLKYYSFEQTEDRLAQFIAPIKIDQSTLLNFVRSKQLAPYIWFHGFAGTLMGGSETPYYENKVGLFEPIRGYLKLDYARYLDSLQHLLFGNNKDIFITEVAEFSDLVHGEQAASLFNGTGIIFSKNILADQIIELPVQIKTLCDLGLQPGVAILKKDIYFSVEEVEALDPQKVKQNKVDATLIEQLQKENSFLKLENKKLTLESKKVHPALDSGHERFAPELYIALKTNDYVFEEQQKQKDREEDVESYSKLADQFFEKNKVPGSEDGKLRMRLRAVSNPSSKKNEIINLAKSIK